MSIELKQFAGASVTPADDAKLYNFLLGDKTGIAEGIEVTYLGGNQLKISSGWGICKGRMFVVEEETINAALSAEGSVPGRLLLNIDITQDVPATFVTQAGTDAAELIQEDINGSGTVYQIQLASYTVNEIAVSNLVRVNNGLLSFMDHINSAMKSAMLRQNYDTNLDGIVDNAERVNGVWFDFKDENGEKSEELHAHWLEDGDGNPVIIPPSSNITIQGELSVIYDGEGYVEITGGNE